MNTVKVVAPNFIFDVWKDIESFLNASINVSGGDFTLDQLKFSLGRGEQTLLVSVNEQNIINGAMTAMGFGAGAAGLTGAFGYSPTAISGGTFGAPEASAYMSPYASNVTDIAVREAERQRDLARSGRMTGAIGRGTFGGARQTLADVEAERGAAQGISDIRFRGAQSGYENAQKMFEADQARRMQAAQLGQQAQQFQAGLGKDIGLAGMMAGIDTSGKLGALGTAEQTANLERLKAQAATEGEKQALQQQINDMKYQQFQEQKDFQRNQLEYLSNILRGNAGALGSTQVQYTPQPSTASQIASLGLSGLALSKALS
jgi:hypothetical protein